MRRWTDRHRAQIHHATTLDTALKAVNRLSVITCSVIRCCVTTLNASLRDSFERDALLRYGPWRDTVLRDSFGHDVTFSVVPSHMNTKI